MTEREFAADGVLLAQIEWALFLLADSSCPNKPDFGLNCEETAGPRPTSKRLRGDLCLPIAPEHPTGLRIVALIVILQLDAMGMLAPRFLSGDLPLPLLLASQALDVPVLVVAETSP